MAVVGGAGDSLFDAVRASGADVYVTADLRHHPASELRERAALEAGTSDPAVGTPYLVEVSHAASEWPWLAGAARRLEAEVARRWPGTTVETRVSTLPTDPWTFRLDPDPSGGPAMTTAPVADQHRLLEVQALDTRAQQLDHAPPDPPDAGEGRRDRASGSSSPRERPLRARTVGR